MEQGKKLPLANLKILKKEMRRLEYYVDPFTFIFKNFRYVVLVKLFEDDEIIPQYALLKLEFMRSDDMNISLEVTSNASHLFVDAKTLRKFFSIEYGYNLGDILLQFYMVLGRQIPTNVNENRTVEQEKAVVKSITDDDSDIEKIHCYSIRRNSRRADGKLGQRSKKNDLLARRLQPDLYKKVCSDKSLSFCFSSDPNARKSKEEILDNFLKHSKLMRQSEGLNSEYNKC